MTFQISPKKNPLYDVKGLSHVAFVIEDMQRTVDFYQGVLGFPLIKTVTLPFDMGQHFFFDMGDGHATLAFFWFPTARKVAPGITMPRNNVGDMSKLGNPDNYVTAIGSMNHIAFNIDADKLLEYKAKLEAAGIWVAPVMDHDDGPIGAPPDESLWLSSIYFRDPDGIQLEFAAWIRPFGDGDADDVPATATAPADRQPAGAE